MRYSSLVLVLSVSFVGACSSSTGSSGSTADSGLADASMDDGSGSSSGGGADSGNAETGSSSGGSDSGSGSGSGGGADSGAAGSEGGVADGGAADGGARPDAGSEAGTFSVASLSGLVLWLDAGHGVTQSTPGAVTGWTDQSSACNSATASLPLPGYAAKAINGLPAVTFAGNSMSIADSTSLQFGFTDALVEVVVQWTGAPSTSALDGYGLIFAKQVYATYPYYGVGLYANYPLPAPSSMFGVQTSYTDYVASTSTGLNDGKARLVGMARKNGTVDVRVNGGSQGSMEFTPLDDISAVGNPVYIGAQQGGSGNVQQLTGSIAEIVAIKGGISAPDLQQLESYLMTKYNL